MEWRDLEQLPPWARSLLADAPVARLGYSDEGDRPRVLPVTFALADGSIWSAIDRKPKRRPGREPARVRCLHRRPAAALTVDRYEDDWRALAWVQALGEVELLPLEAAPAALGALTAKYPQYRDEPPVGPLLRLVPERLLAWRATGGSLD